MKEQVKAKEKVQKKPTSFEELVDDYYDEFDIQELNTPLMIDQSEVDLKPI